MDVRSLRCEIPTLEPDEDFCRRLASLAAASSPSDVVLPVAFGGPATRALAAAAAVAAITAGAAAAADRLTHSHPTPSPPISTRYTEAPSPSPSGGPTRHHRAQQADYQARHDQGEPDPSTQPAVAGVPPGPTGAADPTAVSTIQAVPATHQPSTHQPDDDLTKGSTDEPSDQPSDQLSDEPTDDPSDQGAGDGSDSLGDGSGDGSGDGGDGSDDGSTPHGSGG